MLRLNGGAASVGTVRAVHGVVLVSGGGSSWSLGNETLAESQGSEESGYLGMLD